MSHFLVESPTLQISVFKIVNNALIDLPSPSNIRRWWNFVLFLSTDHLVTLGRDRWIFAERKNPEYDFLRKGSKAVGPVS